MRKRLVVLLLACLMIPATGMGQQKSAPATTDLEYRLGPDDVIQVQIWGRADLSGATTVDDQGKIELPLVGEIEAKGRTPAELSRSLTDRYQLLDPSIPEVRVTVSEYKSNSITVVGEVRSPGQYAFRAIPDLWTVLLTAGGANHDADLGHVQVVRKDEVTGEPHIVNVDLSHGIEGTTPGQMPLLHPKDTVIVPSLSGNAVSGDKFQVLGAVRNPGAYPMNAAKNVVEAIAASGGPAENADMKKVRISRPTGEGALAYQMDIEGYLMDGKPTMALALKPGDTVVVPRKNTAGAAILQGVGSLVPVLSVIASVVSLVVVSRR